MKISGKTRWAISLVLAATHILGTAEAAETITSMKTEKATFGGGCFWCTHAIFQRLDGVVSVSSGYAGGHTENPTYQDVCNGNTGHAEVIQVEYEPDKVSYGELIDLFWDAHDPTTLNRQGADIGTQYRSIILYHNDVQKETALKSRREAASRFDKKIVTEIVPMTRYYAGEEYHQDYFNSNRAQPYCSVVIEPKVKKLQKSGKIRKE